MLLDNWEDNIVAEAFVDYAYLFKWNQVWWIFERVK